MSSIGPYLAGGAFWIFMAAVAIVAIITDYKRRRGNVEVLRAAIDKGQQLDPMLVEKLMSGEHRDDKIDPTLVKLGGIITLAAGIGICLLSFFISRISPVALYPILGGGVVVICIGVGLLVGARVLDAARARDASRNPPP
jgi:Domain of unknown function (DUF6249)